MFNSYKALEKVIGIMNRMDEQYLFIQANSIHNIPPFPYAVVNILTPYIADKDTFKGTVTHQFVNENIEITRCKEPKISLSFTFYNDEYETLFDFMTKASSYLQTVGKQELSKNGIILIDVGNVVDKTTVIENEFYYKYGFDITVRVLETFTEQYNYIESVDIMDNVNNKKIQIKED